MLRNWYKRKQKFHRHYAGQILIPEMSNEWFHRKIQIHFLTIYFMGDFHMLNTFHLVQKNLVATWAWKSPREFMQLLMPFVLSSGVENIETNLQISCNSCKVYTDEITNIDEFTAQANFTIPLKASNVSEKRNSHRRLCSSTFFRSLKNA